MDLEQLRLFIAVAESGSFSRGAQKLYFSHSTASRTVSALEAELGVRLLDRDNRVLGLTKAGEVLLKEARELLRAADEAALRVRQAGQAEEHTGREELEDRD